MYTFCQAKCSGSWVIVFTRIGDDAENNTALTSTGSNNLLLLLVVIKTMIVFDDITSNNDDDEEERVEVQSMCVYVAVEKQCPSC